MVTMPTSHCPLLDAPVGVLGTTGPREAVPVTARWFVDDAAAVRSVLNTTKHGADVRTADRSGEERVVLTVRPVHVNTWGHDRSRQGVGAAGLR
jgi:hypothetical protein